MQPTTRKSSTNRIIRGLSHGSGVLFLELERRVTEQRASQVLGARQSESACERSLGDVHLSLPDRLDGLARGLVEPRRPPCASWPGRWA